MPNWCVVAACQNSSKKIDRNGRMLRFFRFPADLKIQKKWIAACHRKDSFSTTNARICSEHFTNEDYEDELRARLMGKVPVRLKKTAIPTQYLSPIIIKKGPKPIPEEVKIKQRKELVEQLLKEHGELPQPLGTVATVTEVTTLVPEEHSVLEVDDSHMDPQSMVESILEAPEGSENLEVLMSVDQEVLLKKIMELENENKALMEVATTEKARAEAIQKKLHSAVTKINILENRNDQANKRIQKLEGERLTDGKNFDKKVKELFKPCLSPNQIDIMLKKKSKARWTQEEFSKAFTLRYLSQRSYAYVKDTLNYPLPGLSTLRKWASLSQLKSGVLDDVFRIMEISGQNKTPVQRCTVLSFSEMKVASVYEYNDKEDDIIGPHNYMQVIMAQGLFDDWKQPVYIEFDKKITKEILLSVITKLDKIGFSVVVCTCNCSGVNQGIWKDFGVSLDNTYIGHPVTNEKIHFFPDPPSLLKLLRNWFLDTGFVLHGQIITKDPVAALINIPSDEISLTPILTKHHITCEEAQRHNFRLAKELFSYSTAMALQRHLPGDKDLALRVSNFINLVNSWFDLMSVPSMSGEIPTKKPYGVQRGVQFETLEDMVIMMKGMLRVGKNSLQIFQKGIIITCKSLEELYKDMQQRHGITYILTARLSQDCLEKFCAQLRAGYVLHDHPSPKVVIQRLRKILLGKSFDKKNANFNNEPEPDEYLITEALKQANIDVPIECSTIHDAPEDNTEKETVEAQEIPMPTENYQLLALAQRLVDKYYGRQVQPPEHWLEQVKKMDMYFIEFHCLNYSDPHDILIRKACDYILQKFAPVNLDPKLVEYFVIEKLSIRIDHWICGSSVPVEQSQVDNTILKRRLLFGCDEDPAKIMRPILETMQ